MERASHELALASSFDVYKGVTSIAVILRHRRSKPSKGGVVTTIREAHLGFPSALGPAIALLRGLEIALDARTPSLRIYSQNSGFARRLRRSSAESMLSVDELDERIDSRLRELDHFTTAALRRRLIHAGSLARAARELPGDDALYLSMSSSWRRAHPPEPVRAHRYGAQSTTLEGLVDEWDLSDSAFEDFASYRSEAGDEIPF